MAQRSKNPQQAGMSLQNLPMPQKMMLGVDALALCQIDVDAIQVYNAVIEKIDDDRMGNQIEEFRGDHERHVRDIRGIVERLGLQPPSNDVSPLGKRMLGVVREASNEKDILTAFLANEHLSSEKYGECVPSVGFLPDEVGRIIVQGATDENRHWEWAVSEMRRLDPGFNLGPAGDMHEELKSHLGETR